MAFGSSLSRILRSRLFLQNLGEDWQCGWYKIPNSIRRSITRSFKIEHPRRTILKAILILSHEPRHRIQVEESSYAIRDREERSLLGDARDAVLILTRILTIGLILVALIVAYSITRLTRVQVFPTILQKGIEFLGPIFIKFGQWASTRKDLFPEDVCGALSQLQRTAAPHSWIYTKRLLEATYGSSWRNVFVEFENEAPIGSGCCAQVYKAWVDLDASVEATQEPRVSPFIEITEYLKLGSLVTFLDRRLVGAEEIRLGAEDRKKLQPVAVKVLHPGIKGQLRRDLAILRGICKCATYVFPQLQWLSLTDCMDEFSQTMENQVDMNREAANLMKFSHNFSNKKDVGFPRPYTRFTRREILVESFHEGSPISDYLECNDAPLQRRLAKLGITTILKMVFKDNFIHCDLHPGNILVEIERESRGRRIFASLWKRIDPSYVADYPRLIILDCGLVVSLDDRCRRNLRNVFRSVLVGNGELAAQYILEHSSQATSDPDGFKTTMRDIVDSHLRDKVDLKNVSASTVVSELFSAMVRHRVKQDGSFSSVILSMVVIESLGRTLDPDIDVFAEVLPFVFTRAA